MKKKQKKVLIPMLVGAAVLTNPIVNIGNTYQVFAQEQKLIGDINLDGKINDTDLQYLKYMASLDLSDSANATWKPHMWKADINEDGEANQQDVELMKKYLDGEISSFKVEKKEEKKVEKKLQTDKRKEEKKVTSKNEDKKQANDIKHNEKKVSIKLSENKKATASGSVRGEEAYKALDGKTSNNSKWCSTQWRDKWLMVDLGEECSISKWGVKHAQAGGERKEWNTRDFKLQKSDDGKTWTDVDEVVGNTAGTTNRNVSEFTARYVRLYITKATQTRDKAARIYEFEVYGSPSNENSKSKEVKEKKSSTSDYNEKINFTTKDMKGNTVSLSDFKGKKVYLTYWAMEIPEGRRHIERLNELYKAVKDKEDIVILSVGNNPAASWARNHEYSVPLLLEKVKEKIDYSDPVPWGYEIAEKLNASGWGPYSYIIDEYGNILKKHDREMTIKEMKEFSGIKTAVQNERKDAYNPKTNFTVKDSNGKKVSLSDYVGKKVFLTYWYPQEEKFERHLENVNKINKALKGRDDIAVLTVTFSGAGDYSKFYAQEKGYKFPILIDEYTGKGYDMSTCYKNLNKILKSEHKIASKLNIQDTNNPASYLIDEDGKILKTSHKEMNLNQLKEFMNLKDLNVVDTPAPKDTYNTKTNFVVNDMFGNRVELKDYKGKKVLLTYWYGTSENMFEFLEKMNEVYNRNKKDDFVVLTMTSSLLSDWTREYISEKRGYDFPVLVDIGGWYPQNGKFTNVNAGRLKVDDAFEPSVYLIDENGNIIKEHHGKTDGDMSVDEIVKFSGLSKGDLKPKSEYKSRRKYRKVVVGDYDHNNELDQRDLKEAKYLADLQKNDPYTYATYRLLIKDSDMNGDGVITDEDVKLLEETIQGKRDYKYRTEGL